VHGLTDLGQALQQVGGNALLRHHVCQLAPQGRQGLQAPRLFTYHYTQTHDTPIQMNKPP
jgi:hypothetical protein